MHIEIQRNAVMSITNQIYHSVLDQIRSDFIEEGSPLPSVRKLSKQLGVSLVTVVKAYQKLEQDGFITSVQGKGTFIKKDKKGSGRREEREQFIRLATVSRRLFTKVSICSLSSSTRENPSFLFYDRSWTFT